MSEEYLTVSQAAAYLSVSERTVRRRCEAGTLAAKLETTDSGKSWMIEAAAIGAVSTPPTADTQTNSRQGELTARADDTDEAAAIVRPEEIATIRNDIDQLKAIVTTDMANRVREALADLPSKGDMQAAVTAAIEPLIFEIKSAQERDTKAEVAAAVGEVLAPYIAQLDRVAIENQELREQLAQQRAARPFWQKWRR